VYEGVKAVSPVPVFKGLFLVRHFELLYELVKSKRNMRDDDALLVFPGKRTTLVCIRLHILEASKPRL